MQLPLGSCLRLRYKSAFFIFSYRTCGVQKPLAEERSRREGLFPVFGKREKKMLAAGALFVAVRGVPDEGLHFA